MYDIIPPSAVIGARSRKAACHPRRHRDGRVRADCRHGRGWVISIVRGVYWLVMALPGSGCAQTGI